MGTYKEIRGTHIVSVTSDPPSPVNGQMWYNSTDRAIKGSKSNPAGVWASSTAMNTGRNLLGASGTSTAALAFGGQTAPGGVTAVTENWNGTSWTEVNDLNTARGQHAGFGTSTAALATGGVTPPSNTLRNETESWNGSSWTEVNNLNTARRYLTGAGTVPNGLVFAGYTTANSALTESWNGSSWTE